MCYFTKKGTFSRMVPIYKGCDFFWKILDFMTKNFLMKKDLILRNLTFYKKTIFYILFFFLQKSQLFWGFFIRNYTEKKVISLEKASFYESWDFCKIWHFTKCEISQQIIFVGKKICFYNHFYYYEHQFYESCKFCEIWDCVTKIHFFVKKRFRFVLFF